MKEKIAKSTSDERKNFLKQSKSKVKLSPFSRGGPEGSLFDSYYTKV